MTTAVLGLGRLKVNEAQFTTTVVDIAKTYGWHVTHFRPAKTERGWRTPLEGHSGFPDLVLARGGIVLLAELKIGRARPRPDQTAWAEAIGPSYRLWYPKDLPAIIGELRNHRPSAVPDPFARSQPE